MVFNTTVMMMVTLALILLSGLEIYPSPSPHIDIPGNTSKVDP